MHLYVFLDLDDTLFQTQPKCPAGAPLAPVAYRQTGEPLSYMTERQRKLLSLFEAGTIIPATARNHDAFRRVRLPFDSLAILDFGGVVLLPDRTPDQSWDEVIRPRALALREEFEFQLARVKAFCDEQHLDVTVRIISDFGMPLYLVVKHPQADTEALRVLHDSDAWPRGAGWFTHFNDNNLSLVPSFLGKEKAAAHVIETHLDRAQSLIIGCADSLSDAPFLALCDFAMLPQESQLSALLQRDEALHRRRRTTAAPHPAPPPGDDRPAAALPHSR